MRHVIYDCFHAITTELGSHDKPYSPRGLNMDHSALYTQVMQIPCYDIWIDLSNYCYRSLPSYIVTVGWSSMLLTALCRE